MTDASESSFAAARARVDRLAGELAAIDGAAPRLIETAISWVLLGRMLAYKVKKPLRLPYLDFSTLAARRSLCAEELRLNRRFAPGLYLDVVEIRDGPGGASFAGTGPLLDAAVRMRRFPDGALWSERIASGALAAAQVDAFAVRLAAVHRDGASAPARGPFGSAASYGHVARRSIAAVDAWQRNRGDASPAWPPLREWLLHECDRLAPHWGARLASGAIRECHGDLHLANVLQMGDEPTAFDGIEFDPALRWIDPLDDAAFLAMDLIAHDRRDLAFRFLDGYLAESGAHDGLPGLRFFLVSRALVRAQVGALCEARGIEAQGGRTASDYLRVAAALAKSADARLAITHGLPGSGKTFASQLLLEHVGAIRIRSDVERKRLFGLAPLESSRDRADAAIYGPAATERTYARLRDIAQTALAAGWPTIVDAAFLRRSERVDFALLAAACGAPFAIVDCRAALPLLRRRVAARQASGTDASEADAAVLERLVAADEPLDANERAQAIVVDAGAAEEPAALATRWQAMR